MWEPVVCGVSQQLDAMGSPGAFLDCSAFPGHMK